MPWHSSAAASAPASLLKFAVLSRYAFTCAPCWRGASTLSMLQAICETLHDGGKGVRRMETDDFEVYPIAHNGRVYNIITGTDMTFREVRAMLDWLDAQDAFVEDDALGPGKLYTFRGEGVLLEVDVQGFEVIVYRRETVW